MNVIVVRELGGPGKFGCEMYKSDSVSTKLNMQMMLAMIVGLLYTGMTTYAIAQVKLIPSDVVYFSNEGSLTLICTVDQDVRINSVTFRRDGINYVGIFNPTIPQCNATKFVGDDTSVYFTACDQERSFTLNKHGTNAENHRKRWTCVMNSLAGGPCVGANNPCLSQNVTSVIQVPVTTVQLTNGSDQTSSSVNIVRGQSTIIRCSTAPNGSRPHALFQWYIRQGNQSPVLIVDQSISPTPDPITVAGQESDIVISYSTWTLTGNASYHNMYIYCKARDKTNIGNYTKSDEVQFNIVYPPDVQISSNQYAYNVTEGTQNFVFSCNIIEANPLPQANSYSWFHKTSIIQGPTSSSYTLPSVQRTDAGEYRCTARNDYGTGTSNTLKLVVQYAPVVKLQAEIRDINPFTVEEGRKNVVLMCEIIAAHPQPTLYVWTHDGSEVQNVLRSNFTIPVATRQTNGTWGCKGVNDYGTPLESQLQIDVQYGPVIDHIGNKTAIEGHLFAVTCKVDSNPPAVSVSWIKVNNATFSRNTDVLTINSVSRNDIGTYGCTAINRIHPSGEIEVPLYRSEEFYLNVQYGALIINLSVAGNNTVNENMTATLTCVVDSNPESNITWTKHGLESLKTDVNVHQSQLTIEHAECFDTDNYTCHASNGLGSSVERKVPLYVTCHPRTDFQSPPVKKVYGKHYGNASLRYTVISFPEPTFNWTFIGNGSENRWLPNSATQINNGLESVLKFINLGINDFGFYNVTATNLFSPSATETFQLTQADLPEVPSNVTITDVKQTSMTVQWVAGYNGGTEQTFHILITAGNITRTVYLPDPGYGKVGSYNIEELVPNTEYNIWMSANNSVGSSNSTNVIFQITLKVPDISTSTGMLISAVAGGISAGIVAILLVGIGIIVWRRYQHSKKSLDELVENPVYASSDVRPNPVGEYAAVDKSTKKGSQKEALSNLFAMVNKTSGQNCAVKGKNGKISRGEIYENATFGGRSTDKENMYENPGKSQTEAPCENVYENPHSAASNETLINKDGLLYADLMLDLPTTKNGKPVIRGLENCTVYADIAYGKRGEPLPDNEEKEHGSCSNDKREVNET